MAVRISILFILISTFSTSRGGGFGETSQLFSQFAVDGGATTIFVVHNPGAETIAVRIEMRRSDGSVFVDETVTLGPGTTTTIEKGGGPGELTVGWARLSSSSPFTATEFFKIIIGTQELPRVGVLPSKLSDQSQLFGFVQTGVLNTGIAAANPSSTESAQITVRLIDSDGTVVATKEESLGPNEHFSRFLDRIIEELEEFEGVVEIESNRPIILLALRSDDVLLSTVAVVTPNTPGIIPGSITTEFLAEGAVTQEKIAENQVVKSINGLRDQVTLQAGPNVNITPIGNTLRISAIGGGEGSGDITSVTAGDGLTGGGNFGAVSLSLAVPLNLAGDHAAATIRGVNSNTLGAGIEGSHTGNGSGVQGSSTDGVGVSGNSTNVFGVLGQSENGTGVRGSSTIGWGVRGSSVDGVGVRGRSTNGVGVRGISSNNYAASFSSPFSEIQMGDGGFLTSTNPSQALLSAGTFWNGLEWVATSTSATVIEATGDEINMYSNTDLTPASRFNLERVFAMDSGGNITIDGVLTENSDRSFKRKLAPVDPEEVLNKVTQLPLSFWSYKTDEAGIRHLGPMAQDFYRTFGLGKNDKGIATMDSSGVALAAIQALYQMLQETRAELNQLKSGNNH